MGTDHQEVVKLKELFFFHQYLDRHQAECILLQNGKDGSFLIRNSSRANEFAVSVRAETSVKHYNLTWTGEVFKFGHGVYETCDALEQHFHNKPMLAGETGQTSLLSDPYPNNVPEPALYDTVRAHAEGAFDEVQTRNDYSINSKEGYMNKLGGFVKNWKIRWFVLHNNELKYFKNPSKKEPIRVLDLDDCRECEMEGEFKGKDNVFRLVFDWRTFYIFCASKEETQEWVKVINWKLHQKDSPET